RRMPIGPGATFHPGFCHVEPTDSYETPGPALAALGVLGDMDEGIDPFDGSYLDYLDLWILVEDGHITEFLDAFYICAG
ncbi:MAG: hypothetical protein P8N02_05800, partial [Actinomycetota bacterium]|nr:hypothetical protein [Actinomycetota bacterium]